MRISCLLTPVLTLRKTCLVSISASGCCHRSRHVCTHTKYMKKEKDRGYYPCAYSRCSHRAPTQEDLWHQHVLLNHLQRIELQCPVQCVVQPHPSQRTLALQNTASTSSRSIGLLPTVSQRARRKQLEPEEEQVDLCTIEFDDFEPGRTFESDNARGAPFVPRHNIVTHPEPFRTEVSRPPVLVQPPKVLEPPPSILYHAWEIEVDKRLPPEPQAEDDEDDGPSEPDSDYDSEDCDPTTAHMPVIASSTPRPFANETGSNSTPSSSQVASQANRDARYADRGARKRTAGSPPESCSARPSKTRRTSMQDISDLAADLHLDT
ncbi:hypothetical protein GGG16DRAFT_44979 [Schizophyllum commune]